MVAVNAVNNGFLDNFSNFQRRPPHKKVENRRSRI